MITLTVLLLLFASITIRCDDVQKQLPFCEFVNCLI